MVRDDAKLIRMLKTAGGQIEGIIRMMEEKLDLILQEIGSMKQEMGSMKQEMGSMKQELTARIDTLEDKVTKVQLTLENETNKKINIIGEGHDLLKERLAEALQMEKKNERMELEILDMKIHMRDIDYDISNLKRALAIV